MINAKRFYPEHHGACDRCGAVDDLCLLPSAGEGRWLCEACFIDFFPCSRCGEYFDDTLDFMELPNGDEICPDCQEELGLINEEE